MPLPGAPGALARSTYLNQKYGLGAFSKKPPKQAMPTGDFWKAYDTGWQDTDVPGMSVGNYDVSNPAMEWQKLNLAGSKPDWWNLMLADPTVITGQGDYDQ